MSKQKLSERQIRELDLIEMMTFEYEKYLKICKFGGDWDLHSFMKSLNKKAKKVKELNDEGL